MITNCLKFSLVAAFLLILQPSFAQRSLPAADAFLDADNKTFGTNFRVVVVTADSVAYQKSSGDLPPRLPVPVGAGSQWFTTVLLLQLADEGKISLDDKVSKYLPVFDSYRKGYITLRHCLTHQTGIGTEGFKPAQLFEKKKFNTLEEEVLAIVKKEIHANAGEQFRYSNYGFIIAARVAEVVAKKRFDLLIRSRLFVPLGLRNTSFATTDGTAPNPATGAQSTAADLGRFLQMLLNGGRAGDKQILSTAAIAEMRRIQVAAAQTPAAPKAAEGLAYALGCWAVNGTAAGQTANVLLEPGGTGSWEVVDFGRGYALTVVAKDFNGEQTAAPYTALKALLDPQFPLIKEPIRAH